jgi:hypothetical protein
MEHMREGKTVLTNDGDLERGKRVVSGRDGSKAWHRKQLHFLDQPRACETCDS